MTKGLEGRQLTEMGMLAEAGAVGFSDDGLPVADSQVMRRALSYARTFGLIVSQHAEDLSLSSCGCMAEGEISTRLGLPGIPDESEIVVVERDIRLVELTGGRYHVAHISTAGALDAVRRAKRSGLPVTCEVAPHHFALTDHDVGDYRTFAKMAPPLRSEANRKAMVEGLKDGTIDAIASDHAPHDQESKRVPMERAANGIVGLETMLPLSLELYHGGHLSLRDVLRRLTSAPADLLGLDAGRLRRGAPADSRPLRSRCALARRPQRLPQQVEQHTLRRPSGAGARLAHRGRWAHSVHRHGGRGASYIGGAPAIARDGAPYRTPTLPPPFSGICRRRRRRRLRSPYSGSIGCCRRRLHPRRRFPRRSGDCASLHPSGSPPASTRMPNV